MDLSPFCGKDPNRENLHQPFSRGEWTYATNGAILVRVPRREVVPDNPDAPDAGKLFADRPDSEHHVALPVVEIPKPDPDEECEHCDGRGSEHDCPDCNCACEHCGGTGRPSQGKGISVGIGTAIFAARYVLLLQRLPGVTIATPDSFSIPAHFRFDGGEGLLMQIRGRSSEHIDTNSAAVTTGQRE